VLPGSSLLNILGIILVSFTLYAQEPPTSKLTSGAKFVVSFSHQPLETFKAAFLARVQNIALYEATVRNIGTEPGSVSGGELLQAAQEKIPTVNTQLVVSTLSRARKKSTMFKVMKVVEWMAFAGSVVTSSGVLKANDAIKLSLLLVASSSDKLSASFASEGVDPASLGNWIRADTMVTLMPRQSWSGLFLGGWSKGHQFETFITVLGELNASPSIP
jgi:hypothetical protein